MTWACWARKHPAQGMRRQNWAGTSACPCLAFFGPFGRTPPPSSSHRQSEAGISPCCPWSRGCEPPAQRAQASVAPALALALLVFSLAWPPWASPPLPLPANSPPPGCPLPSSFSRSPPGRSPTSLGPPRPTTLRSIPIAHPSSCSSSPSLQPLGSPIARQPTLPRSTDPSYLWSWWSWAPFPPVQPWPPSSSRRGVGRKSWGGGRPPNRDLTPRFCSRSGLEPPPSCRRPRLAPRTAQGFGCCCAPGGATAGRNASRWSRGTSLERRCPGAAPRPRHWRAYS
mmetsp:Transcript_122760/g.281490  ORF Transcript_122760/g.281490 Transcript_122760/m.281490 type:complete len:283 (-) Transcript_122760:392-1240(-)